MKKYFIILTATIFLIACNNASDTSNTEKKDTTNTMASNNSSTMNKQERNKQNILAAIRAASDGNADELAKYFAADVVDHGDGSGPEAKSMDSVKAGMKMFFASFPDMKIDPIVTTADGDYVVVYSNWTGTFKGDMGPIKATNKSFKTKDADIFKMNDDGKIIEHWSVMPMSEIWKGVGAKMPMK